ncbi:prolyl peptidase [Magnaporthiopsis poae ATCC 64411]|uniref:Prolyl peptidase n=1 Tax=Magnaporthiopsis poae (strain ATCC 64411 / 73-15) TaxID=644358 RepID=A0A0C4E9C7_MAGP6|nr:prolyl peptidase [Magnaporthiopsis poae ATCC 64411]
MDTICSKGRVDPFTATWQPSIPLFTACSARGRPTYKYGGPVRQRHEKTRMDVNPSGQNEERRSRRRKSHISRSPEANDFGKMSGISDPYLGQNGKVGPAELLEEKPVAEVPEEPLQKHEFTFRVPRDYKQPNGDRHILHVVVIREKKAAKGSKQRLSDFQPLPSFCYLCGGPGSPQEEDRHRVLTKHAVGNGFQMLLVDYRGTGGSEKLDLARLANGSDDEKMRAFQQARPGNIVRDYEAVRLYLAQKARKANVDDRLILMGQSYGGWIALLYAQRYPRSLRGIMLTGGMPPITASPVKVYEKLFESVAKDNETFYNDASIRSGNKEDPRTLVLRVAKAILARPGRNPRGNNLSLATFASLGRRLGQPGGAAQVSGTPSAACAVDSKNTVFDIVDTHTFNKRIIYAFEHETQCYVSKKGDRSLWSAKQVRDRSKHYKWVSAKSAAELDELAMEGEFFLLGETFMPEHAEDYADLRNLGGVAFAEKLAARGQTEDMWDVPLLKANLKHMDVFSVTFPTDMYVNADLAEDATKQLGNAVKSITLHPSVGLRHNAIRADPDKLLLIFKDLGCTYFSKTVR